MQYKRVHADTHTHTHKLTLKLIYFTIEENRTVTQETVA